LLFRAGTGVVLVVKRPENGQFRWPKIRDGGSCAALRCCSFSARHNLAADRPCGSVSPSSLKKSPILF